MAWSEQLPSGKYRATYRDRTGKRRSAGTFAHKAAAVRAANAAEDAARRSGWRSPDTGRQTWGEWCKVWWPTRLVAPSTLIRDQSRRDVHLMPRWEHVELADITRHDIRGWIAKLLASGRAPGTVQRITHLFSASLNAAVDAEILPANPAAKLKLPGGQETTERYLTYAEVDAIVEHMPTVADQTITYLLAYSGMRWGELAGLHWHRVDRDQGVITIAETFDSKLRDMVPWPKGKRSRVVRLPDWLMERLGEPRPGPCGVPHRSGRCQSGLVVTSHLGGVLDSRNWRRVFDPAVADAGLTDVWPHLLRHTMASWLIQDGAPLSEVGQVLGHLSSMTTQRYAHLVDKPSDRVLGLQVPAGVAARKLTIVESA